MTEIDRRSLLLGTLAVGMTASVAVAKILPSSPEVGRYSIGDSNLCVEWGWYTPGVWEMSSRDGVTWYNDGRMNDPRAKWSAISARELILEHFGLQKIADQLPLEVISTIPPFRLFAMRRHLETALDISRIDMISDRGGAHCCASTIA